MCFLLTFINILKYFNVTRLPLFTTTILNYLYYKARQIVTWNVIFTYFLLFLQDTVVLWSKSSTLDRKDEGSNPAAANFSFEVDDLDAQRKKEDGNQNRRARERPLTRERAQNRTLSLDLKRERKKNRFERCGLNDH